MLSFDKVDLSAMEVLRIRIAQGCTQLRIYTLLRRHFLFGSHQRQVRDLTIHQTERIPRIMLYSFGDVTMGWANDRAMIIAGEMRFFLSPSF